MPVLPFLSDANFRRRCRSAFVAAATIALLLAVGVTAQACPTCGAGMAEGGEAGQKMLNGWFWSIVFMMSMPFAIVTSLGGYMYWIVRKARRAEAADAAETADGTEPNVRELPTPVVSNAT